MDIRPDRMEEVIKEVPVIHQFTNLDEALSHASEFTGVAVCSPANVHVEQARAVLDLDLPVLVEKPVSTDVDSCSPLFARLQQGGKLLLGYPYRWWTPVRQLKTLISAGAIGAPRHARFVMSARSEDVNAPQVGQVLSCAEHDLNGGLLLEQLHFIDLMLWIFGMPDRIFARTGQIASTEKDAADVVDIVATYADQVVVTVHMDLFGRPHEQHIVVTGEEGTIQCLFSPDALRLSRTPELRWETEYFSIERNDMFLGVAREFLNILDGNNFHQTCTLEDGVRTLKVVEACKQSQGSRSEVILTDTVPVVDTVG